MKQVTGLLLCLLFSISSCKKESKTDDQLSLEKIPYSGSELRTDGYYYNEYISGYFTVYLWRDSNPEKAKNFLKLAEEHPSNVGKN